MLRRISKGLLIVFLFIVFFPSNTHGNLEIDRTDQITILQTTEKVHVYSHMTILKDKEKSLTVEDVTSDRYAHKFEETGRGIPNFGYTKDVYWAKFQLKNSSKLDKWLLEISYPPLESITLYTENENGHFDELEIGSRYPFSDRIVPHRNYIFELELGPDETKEYLIRVDTEGSAQLPVTLWSANKFLEKMQVEFIYLGLFYGALSAMALYNLFLFYSLRHRSYIYYVVVIIGSIFTSLALNGLGFQYMWQESPWWNHRSIIFFINIGAIAALLFTMSFLETRKNVPKFKWIAGTLILFNSLNIGCLLFISYSIALNLLVVELLLSISSIIIVGFICLLNGVRQARYFLGAWVVFIIGITISMMADAAYLPLTVGTKYAFQFTAAAEVILLSLALADRINILGQDKRKAQLEARKSQAEAVENLKQSNIIKDEFLAITSHELRTPLYGMIGIAEALHDGIEGEISKRMESQLSMIISSGKRLTELVENILDFSKLKHNSLEVEVQQVDLYELVNVVIAICQPLVDEKPIKLRNHISNVLPSVSADRNRLIQILYNLLGNAIKYTDEGEVIISANLQNGVLQVSIADTGKGIHKNDLDAIFLPFQQMGKSNAREFGGIGIGLSITKSLVELLNGTLEVKSSVGIGSTFSFTLQVYKENEANLQQASGEAIEISKQASIQSKILPRVPIQMNKNTAAKVLIADDEPVNLQVLINYLSLEGYEVTAVTSGEEVLEMVRKEQFDLLILDVMMPKISGYEVTKSLRNDYSLTELPILMLTAKNQLYDKVTSFEMGANDYLTKPCDKEELIARVKTLINLCLITRELTTINQSLERKVQERTKELKATNTNLLMVNEELNKVEQSRTMLLSSLSHELGTPITLIQNYIQAVKVGLIKDDNPRYLEMIQRKLYVLDRLTNDLFELAKLRTSHLSIQLIEIPFYEWMTQLISTLTFDLEQGGRSFVSTGVVHNSALITVDSQRMEQAFSNIVWNAVKHTSPHDGEIRMTTTIVEDAVGEWDKKVRITIIDNGVGIATEDLPYIFDKFYKAKNKLVSDEGSGTGLGLAIAKEIIVFHKGEVYVESKVGKGTTFTIELPLILN